MSELLTKISASYVKPTYTEVKVGDTVRVYTRIKEGEKTRTQYFEGLVIRRRGGIGTSATFTVRRIASGVGVERTFPVHSPLIERVQIQRAAKVRRATLYTMRGLTGKAARLTEQPVKREDRETVHPWITKYNIATTPDEAEQETAEVTEEEPVAEPVQPEVPEGDSGQDEAAAAAEKTEVEAKEEAKDAPSKEIKEEDKAEEVKAAEEAETEADKAAASGDDGDDAAAQDDSKQDDSAADEPADEDSTEDTPEAEPSQQPS